MRRNDITKKVIDDLYYGQLLSRQEVAIRLNCNITTILKRMRKFGIQPRSQSESVKIARQKSVIKVPQHILSKLYLENKLPLYKVAKRLHLDCQTIRRELLRHNIHVRTDREIIRKPRAKVKIKKSILADLYYKKKLTQKEIANLYDLKHVTISNMMKIYGLKTRTPDFYHTKYKKYNFSNVKKEKSYLIGFRLGDLYAKLHPSRRLILVSTTTTKIDQINLFKRLFKKYGNIYISKKRNDSNRVITVNLNRSFDFMLYKKDGIPTWIMKNRKYFTYFLAGYTDAEGCIFIAKSNISFFTLSSYDKNILKQIYKNLLIMGVKCNSPKIRVKKNHKTKSGIVYKKDLWYFSISKKDELLKLLKILRPILKHKKRLMDLKKLKLIYWRETGSFIIFYLKKLLSNI